MEDFHVPIQYRITIVSLLSLAVIGYIAPNAFAADEENALEKETRALAEKYLKLYNEATPESEDFVMIYSEDCVVNGGDGGREALLAIEQGYLKFAPKRKMRLDALYIDGNVAIVQGAIVDADRKGDWSVRFCAVLTCKDGYIVSDDTYADFSKLVEPK